jgi:hypothetical protein
VNWILACMVGSFTATSFFWIRGIWRNSRFDRFVGLLLLAFSCLEAGALGGTTCLLNDVGILAMALGALTIIIGRLGKRISIANFDSHGVLLVAFGIYLALLL